MNFFQQVLGFIWTLQVTISSYKGHNFEVSNFNSQWMFLISIMFTRTVPNEKIQPSRLPGTLRNCLRPLPTWPPGKEIFNILNKTSFTMIIKFILALTWCCAGGLSQRSSQLNNCRLWTAFWNKKQNYFSISLGYLQWDTKRFKCHY